MVTKLTQISNLNESVNDFYYVVNYGGVWNSGSKKCYSETELKTFLATHIFDTMPEILCIKNEINKWDKLLNIKTSSNTNLTNSGRKDIFDKGITTIDNEI